ncbi:MAG: glycine zipper domain-containing protein [Capnocytophaga sp.]|nr:glycine zipper domain-containing protein [Capnocytophaga sp.]
MNELEPIELEIAMRTETAEQNADRLSGELTDLDQSVNRGRQNFERMNRQLAQFSRVMGQYTSTVSKATESQEAYTEMLREMNDKAGSSAKSTAYLNKSVKEMAGDMTTFVVTSESGMSRLANSIPRVAKAVEKLRTENAGLATSGKQATPVWKQLIGALFSWNTVLSVGITLLTVYGKEIGDWLAGVIQGGRQIDGLKMRMEALNKAFEGTEFQKARKDILQLRSDFELARKGIADKEYALQQYNKTLGDVMGRTNDFARAEQNLINKGDAYIQMMFYKSAANAALEMNEEVIKNETKKINLTNEWHAAIKKVKNEIARKQATTTSLDGLDFTNKGTAQQIAMVQKRVGVLNGSYSMLGVLWGEAQEKFAKLQEESAKLDGKTKEIEETATALYNSLNGKFQDIAGMFNFNLTDDDTTPDTKKTTDAYRQLLDQLAALDREYAHQTYDRNEQELKALREKFDKVRQAVKDFNADAGNSLKIPLGGLDSLQTKAEESLRYRQETKALETELGEQRKLFERYEALKTKIGKTEADKRLQAELDGYADYGQRLQAEINRLQTTSDGNGLTAEQSERYQMLISELKRYSEEQERLFQDQLADLLNYEQTRTALIETYQEKRAKLLEQGEDVAAEELRQRHEKELADLDDNNAQKLASYRELFEGIRQLTVREARIVIANARKLIDTVQMSAEMKAKILRQIQQAEETLNRQKTEDVMQVAESVGHLAEAFEDLGNSIGASGLGEAGSALSAIARNMGNLTKALNFNENTSKGERISTGIAAAGSMISTIASATARRRQAEEEYYLSVLGFQAQYNAGLVEQMRLQSILGENSFVKDYAGRVRDGLKAMTKANEEQQAAIAKLMEKGQVKSGQRNAVDWGTVGSMTASGAVLGATIGSVVPVIGNVVGAAVGAVVGFVGGLFAGKKKKDRFVGLLQEYPELIERSENGMLKVNIALAESLKANKLVNDETALILDNIIEWNRQLEESRKQIKEVITELSGQLGDNLKNDLVEAFKSGEDAALRMGESIEKVVENIISSMIFHQIFNDVFTQLEKEMAASQDIGGDGDWVDDFGRFYDAMQERSEAFNEAMEQARNKAKQHGFNTFKSEDESTENTLKGAVKGITAEQADLLAGQFGGLRLAQLETNRINKEGFANLYSETSRMVAVQLQIEINTRRTANNTEHLGAMKDTLKSIETEIKKPDGSLAGNGIRP